MPAETKIASAISLLLSSAWRFGTELLDIIIHRDDRKTVDDNRRSTVVIDTSPIGTVDFGVTGQEKISLASWQGGGAEVAYRPETR